MIYYIGWTTVLSSLLYYRGCPTFLLMGILQYCMMIGLGLGLWRETSVLPTQKHSMPIQVENTYMFMKRRTSEQDSASKREPH